ncbi:MAG: tetratricopeptide repeat protein [Saprospiraceae bacterium]
MAITRLQYLHKLLESTPKDSFVLFALAKEHESAGDDIQSLSFYLRLKESDPAYIGTYYHLGKLYERQEDFQNAILIYKQGIEISRNAGDRHAMSELQGALLNLEDPE